MALLFVVLPLFVVVWAVWGASEYKRLKIALREGRREALLREYRMTIAGEWLFGLLAFLAVGRGIWRASPAFHIALPPGMEGVVWGLLGGMGIAIVLAPLLARRGIGPMQIGDFASLLPQSPPERLLFAVVAVSAGVCEEFLFRGYGLRLFAHAGLAGYALLLTAALAFGLVHIYQGIAGVIVTSVLGLVFSLVYVQTGSLLLPIILHCLVDLRALTLPRSQGDTHAGRIDA